MRRSYDLHQAFFSISLDDMSLKEFYSKFCGICETIDLSEPITANVATMKQQRESMRVDHSFLSCRPHSMVLVPKLLESRSSLLSARCLVIFVRPPTTCCTTPGRVLCLGCLCEALLSYWEWFWLWWE